MKKIIFTLFVAFGTMFAININTASKADFVKIKGIGEKKAERIISYRKDHGKFKSIDDLKKVKGIGDKIITIIKNES